MEHLIKVVDLCKVYNPGENEVRALDHVDLEIDQGEFVAIIGQSGSGKSTFMNMLGCLDVPTWHRCVYYDRQPAVGSEKQGNWIYFSGVQSHPEPYRRRKC